MSSVTILHSRYDRAVARYKAAAVLARETESDADFRLAGHAFAALMDEFVAPERRARRDPVTLRMLTPSELRRERRA